ncbi:hypothetical protein A374_10555 [Fictibacillus macauensis ZFHKF-1]|uniref:Phosphate-binding protein n=1 Tax=Fictibacillus macauensis ZFHKF-1 TaxID=1196324 RepID=I8AHI4_9BACL|nr:phosphate ABC transporter substrate-binding protein [Fictibacillus macauensis]EIT85177.1 hypothetical protein A374_10555 [Fictibacillus macauensis ZFHKF-1]
MKKMKSVYLLAVLALMLVVSTACGNKNGDNKAASAGDKSSSSSESMVISGSSAMQPLVAASAEEFKKQNPKADIQVQAGGSGTGLSQVSQGAVKIGNSDVFAEEKEGIAADQLVDHKIAVVGMSAAVNPEVGLKDISKENLIKVFTGKVKNWKEIGGKDQKVALINRPDSSGTRATFVKYALDGNKPVEGAATEDSSNTVQKLIKETPGAIGYLAFSYFKENSGITPLSINGVAPKAENVIDGKFPIWAYEHSYTKGEPKGLEKEFLDYMMSDAIQGELIPSQGYIAVSKMKVERDAKGKITKK